MVQSWNSSGVKGFLKIIFSRQEKRKLLPLLSFASVADIPFASLKKCGVKAVIFDKDNTLTPPYSFVMDKAIENSVRECQKLFGYDRVVIFSNSAGSEDDKGYLHAEAIEEELGIRVIRHRQKKPDGLLETVALWPGVSTGEVMMVGDRYLTDIYGGNIYGMLTVCVGIFTEQNDNRGAIIGRRVERFLLKLFSCLRVKPLPHPIVAKYLESVYSIVCYKHLTHLWGKNR